MKNFNSTTPETEKDFAQTPAWFVGSLESFLGVSFQLDVCANAETAKCIQYYSPQNDQDSLLLDWSEANFCNPPFSNIAPWIAKAAEQANFGRVTAMIIPDNTETEYSRKAFELCDTVIRMPFRLQFLKPDGTRFLDGKGKPQSPQFPCAVYLFTKIGLIAPTRVIYADLREYVNGKN